MSDLRVELNSLAAVLEAKNSHLYTLKSLYKQNDPKLRRERSTER